MNAEIPLVLIVDDQEASRVALAAALPTTSYDVRFAKSGVDGIAMAATLRPDIILLDYMMPGMTGVEVCRTIRGLNDLAEIPIVFVTALDDRASRLEALDAGADDILTKPVDRIEVRMRVQNITRLNRYRNLVKTRANVQRMYEEVRDAYDQTIVGWGKALELRDGETEGHCERVAVWTVDLALKLGVSECEVPDIRRGALLHDIGKIGIPDSILLKPGPLTLDERKIIERHPTFGRNLLEPIGFLRPAIDIVYHHHERWDGDGYPDRLEGEAIPFAARLFALVDVYDALTSNRPYRAAWSQSRTLAYIDEQSGRHFDPSIAAAFCRMVADNELTQSLTRSM